MSDAGFVAAAKVDELGAGERKLLEIEGRAIALFNVAGAFYAIDDVCTHDGGPLANGEFSGHEVTCPRHGARFDVRTGKALCMPAFENVESHQVKIEGDTVLIKLEDF